MPRFEIEGTTLMSWSARIEANTRADAIEQAQALVARMEEPQPLAVQTLNHRITRCDASVTDDDERLPTAS
jgi:hypothetical protein